MKPRPRFVGFLEAVNLTEKGKAVWVNVYLEDRAFGGREEGGWYYDCMTPDLFTPSYWCRSPEALRIAWDQRTEDCERWNVGRRPIDSVLSEGLYTVRIERRPPRPSPERKPTYE